LFGEVLDSIRTDEITWPIWHLLPHAYDSRINVDADLTLSGPLAPHYCATAKMRFDVSPVRGHKVEQMWVTLTLPSGIVHTESSPYLAMMSIAALTQWNSSERIPWEANWPLG
jgi:hypothetical protein